MSAFLSAFAAVSGVFLLLLPTDAVVAQVVECGGHVLSIRLAGRVGRAAGAEARCVAPAADGHANLGSLVEESADLVERHKRLVPGARVEVDRARERGDDIVDAGSYVLAR